VSAIPWKSVRAVFVGIVVTIVVTTLVDIILHVAGVMPPMEVPLTDRLSALALSYRIVITIGAAWVTARLAPDRSMRHALILGGVGTLLGLLGLAATWGRGMGPAWYPIAIAALAVPQCWAGGKLFELRRRAAADLAGA
jgi:hypothetical protein